MINHNYRNNKCNIIKYIEYFEKEDKCLTKLANKEINFGYNLNQIYYLSIKNLIAD